MSKQQALMETLLGAAELSGNARCAGRIRSELTHGGHTRSDAGYQRLWLAAFSDRRKSLS